MLTLGVSVGEGSAPWVTPRRSVARVDDTEKTRAANATLPASYYGIRLRRDHDRQWPRDVQSFRSIHHRRRETAFMVVPSMNIGIIVLTNAAPVGVPRSARVPVPRSRAVRQVPEGLADVFLRCSRSIRYPRARWRERRPLRRRHLRSHSPIARASTPTIILAR